MLEKDNLQKAFTYIEPGPVTLVTTNDGTRDNVCTISWMMAMIYAPNCRIALATGPWNCSFSALMRSGECCVCIPPANMAKTVVGIGTVNGDAVDKFEKFSLTAVRAEQVGAPLIEECIACLECAVIDYIQKYGLIILECRELWVDKEREFDPTLHANGDGTFRVDASEVVNLRDEMRKWVPDGSERFL